MKIGIDIPAIDDVRDLRTTDFDEFTGTVRSFLDTIDPSEVVNAITPDDIANANFHPNGFFVLRLTDPDKKDEGQIRIHLWHPDVVKIPEADTHRHPWHLGSKVLYGLYLEQLAEAAEVAEEDANFHSVRLENNPTTGIDNPVDPIPLRVDLADPDTYREGASHYMDESKYHYTPMASGLLVTLPVMGGEITPHRRILVPKGAHPKSIENPYPTVTEADAKTMWRHVQLAQQALRNQS